MLIAISGLSGCGNTTLCNTLSTRLQLEPWNYTFRKLGKDMGISLEEVERAATSSPVCDCLVALQTIRRSLGAGAVIGNRLAPWIVDADFRIWLEALLPIRAQRVAGREGRAFEEALEATRRRDEQNYARFNELFEIEIGPAPIFDLILNTGVLDPTETARQALDAVRARSVVATHARTLPEPARRVLDRVCVALGLRLDEAMDLNSALNLRELFLKRP